MKSARIRPALLCLSGLVMCSLHPSAAQGSPTRNFRVTSYKDFAEGQEQGVLLSSQGDALTGLSATRVALPSLSDDSVRSMVEVDGTVYLGTGGDGPEVLAFSKGQLRKVAKLDATTWVTCLIEGTGGDLLAATAQDGRIFQVGRDGRVRVFAKVEGDHVWALLRDRKRPLLYVATGPGKLWSLDLKNPAQKPQKLFDSGARQIMTLALGDDGAIYAGTADDAILYRVEVTSQGAPAQVRALHDFSGNEVRAVAQHGGSLYVAVNDIQRGSSDSSAASRGIRINPVATGTAPGNSDKKPGGSSDRQGKGALYRIEPDGRIDQLHAISDGFFNALHVDGEGNLYAAASTPGGRGKVYEVRPDRTVLTAIEIKESDVLSLSFGKERLIGTGNSGAVYRLSDEPQKDANYQSKVLDGMYPSRWGSLRYSGSGPLHVMTRSGNILKPDSSWSPWQQVQKSDKPSAPGEVGGRIVSPQGRYLQVKVGFGSKAVLHDFTISYQPLNQRPRITEIQVGDDPLGRLARGPRSTGQATGSLSKPRIPLVKLRWKVENPDEDDLSYRLYVRPVRLDQTGPQAKPEPREEGWLRLGGPDPLLRTEYEWNTESVPDGVYEAKVVVSDERSNPADQALTHEMVAPPFVVDNHRPDLHDVVFDAHTQQVSGRAVDAVSPIADLAYAVDGGDFLPVGPKDGVLDELQEDFIFKLPKLGAGYHTVVVRAADAADNVAAVQLVVHTRE